MPIRPEHRFFYPDPLAAALGGDPFPAGCVAARRVVGGHTGRRSIALSWMAAGGTRELGTWRDEKGSRFS